MKKIITLLAVMVCFKGLFGQESLLIRNLKTGETWTFEKNSKIAYARFNENDYTASRIHDFLDSSMVIGQDTVRLNEIASIRKRSGLHKVTRVIGVPVMLIGTIFIGDGIANMISSRDADQGSALLLLGVGTFAMGYLPYLFEFKELTVGFRGEWSIEIIQKKTLKQ